MTVNGSVERHRHELQYRSFDQVRQLGRKLVTEHLGSLVIDVVKSRRGGSEPRQGGQVLGGDHREHRTTVSPRGDGVKGSVYVGATTEKRGWRPPRR